MSVCVECWQQALARRDEFGGSAVAAYRTITAIAEARYLDGLVAA